MVTGTPKMITDGLVLYFDAANVKSYPGSGTRWVDLSPSAASASLTNGALFSTSSNGSIRFDGVDDYIVSNHNQTYQRLTLMAWVNKTGNTYVINKNYFWATNEDSWPCYLATDTNNTIASFQVTNGTSFFITQSITGALVSGSLTNNGWNHIAGTYNGSFIAIYVNGLLAQTQSYAGIINYSGSVVTKFDRTSAQLPWTIGRPAGFHSSGTGFYYATGSIAIASIYNRALSASEVLQNFEATRERFGV